MTLTIEDLEGIARIEKDKRESFTYQINVCIAAGCLSCQSGVVKEAFEKEVNRRGWENWCNVKGVGCLGLCAAGPLISIQPDGTYYRGVGVSDVSEILESLGGTPIPRLDCGASAPFFEQQPKIVLENCGRIDPERIEDYIAEDGYKALYNALRMMRPTEVIEQVLASGLRGRGGAGFPTGVKWTAVAKATNGNKFVVCNADEGDPARSWTGAFWRATHIGSSKAWPLARTRLAQALALYMFGLSIHSRFSGSALRSLRHGIWGCSATISSTRSSALTSMSDWERARLYAEKKRL